MVSKFLKHSLVALGAVAALATGTVEASMRITDAVDGNWFEANRARRGIDFDYIPSNTEGEGVLFMTMFTYDQQGNGIWLTGNSGTLKEFEYRTTFQIGRVNGGDFGSGGNPVPVVLGSAEVEFFSCSNARVTLTMNAGSNLPNTVYNVSPLQNTFGPARKDCVWQTAFQSCPAGTTAGAAPRTCKLEGNYYGQNLRLTNNTTWELGQLVMIGNDNTQPSTLTIEPGTRIIGNARESAVYVNRGSKIFAEGTRNAPIIFTSFKDGVAGQTPATGDWAGVIISGNAPVNCANNTCESEFSGLYGRPLQFGGTNNPTDSSGILRYVQVRYAGVAYQTNREVNSFTLQGVGSGTVLEYLQSYRGQDDDIEFFGGTANVKYFVGTDGGDDTLDWDLGYSGKLQFVLLQQGVGRGENHGIEGANSPTNFDATPRAIPTVSNLTFIGSASPNTNDGLQFKEGSGGKIWNSYVTGFTRSCLRIQQPQTGAQIAAGNLVVRNTRLNCTTNFSGSDIGGADVANFFNSQPGNTVGAAGTVNGFLPGPTSPLKSAGTTVAGDGFFTPTDYVGAFRDESDDWTAGWTYGVRRN